MRQWDRVGVLSFDAPEAVTGLARTVWRLGAGATLRGRADSWRMRLGYAGAWRAGAAEHAVQATWQMRF